MTLFDTDLTGLGYEGLTITEYIEILRAREGEVVVDVRLNPISMKPCFSKTKLSQALNSNGIEYLHKREHGNPKENRAGFSDETGKEGKEARLRYWSILSSSVGREALDEVLELARTKKVALLCFEASDKICHRKLIREAVLEELRTRQLTSH